MRSVAALIAVLAFASSARAQDRALAEAITFARAEGCVEADGLVAHVETWLGRDRVAPELGVIVETGGQEASFAITRDGERVATRRFERLPEACADRRAVIALAIALALDAAILESIGFAPPAAPPPGAEASTPPLRGPAGERPAFSFEVEAALFLEVLPGAAVAGSASLAGIVGGGFRVRGGVVATQRESAAIAHGAAEMMLLAGRLDGCLARQVVGGLLLGGCVGALAGAVLAEGRGFATVRSAQIPWVAAAARPELRWLPVEVLALGLGIEGLFTIVRPRLDVGDGLGGVIDARSLPAVGMGIVLSASVLVE